MKDEAEAFANETGVDTTHIFVGGRSMGGRMCSMAVAEGMPAAGLVLISYPLHPPGKPEKLRVDHFPLPTMPCLFVLGARDAFGSTDELTRHVATIPGPVDLEPIEGGDHGLRGKDSLVTAVVKAWLVSHTKP